MNITVTLFHGFGGWAVTILAAGGLIRLLHGINDWLSDRFTLDLRRLRVHRLAHRPGANVDLGDGRQGVIVYVIRDPDVEEPMAVVQPYDEDDQFEQPEWVPASRLRPLDYQEAS